MSNHRNNNETSSTWHKFTQNRFQNQNLLICIKGYQLKWPCISITIINFDLKSISFNLYQSQFTIKNMSSPRNNKQTWSTWRKIKENVDFKIKNFWSVSKASHSKWAWSTWYIPKRNLVSSNLEHLVQIQREYSEPCLI